MKRIEWNRLDADARRECLARPGAGDQSEVEAAVRRVEASGVHEDGSPVVVVETVSRLSNAASMTCSSWVRSEALI